MKSPLPIHWCFAAPLKRVGRCVVPALYVMSAAAHMAAAQSGTPTGGDPRLSVGAIAEVEVTALNGERETVKLAPADRVVPGDQVIYTLEIARRRMSLPPPKVDYPIPEHMRYLDDTPPVPAPDYLFDRWGPDSRPSGEPQGHRLGWPRPPAGGL